jgi:carboxypeptidase family protein
LFRLQSGLKLLLYCPAKNQFPFLVVVLLLVAVANVNAQSTAGAVLGTVKDPTGNMIPNAVVELINKGTAAKRSTVTSQVGAYQFSNIDAGTYELTVTAPGFQKAAFTSFELFARETRRLDAELKVATQSQTINVESTGGSVVQTDTSSIAETKTGRELVDLPVAIATRGTGSTSPMSTLTTQPGVQTDASGGISVAGALPTMLSITIDGISSVGPRTAGPLTELFPSFNAIEEIRVGEVVNPAEFGGIADITTISKSGTNAFHGGAFENLQNSYMNAGNTFTHTTPTLKMNNFGAFLGGPVIIPKLYNGRDKTFFFASYEALRLPRQVVRTDSVPSLALRNGDLSAYSAPIKGYPGNIIPASQISPLAAKALQYLFPLPNAGPINAISNNYNAYFNEPINSSQGDVRLDQNLTSKQQVYVRFTYKNRRVGNTPTGSALLGPLSQPEIADALTAAYNYVISPTVINELRTGFSGNHSATSYAITASQIASQLGLTNLPGPVPDGNAVPNFKITGFQATGTSTSSTSKNGTFQVLDTLTWTKDKHTMKFGADYRYLTGLYTNVFASSRLGQYTFNSSVMKALLGTGAGTPFASFLLGYPDSSQIATVLQPDTKSYASHYGFFAQDDWKVTPSLTINFGMRYEYHPMFRDHYNNLANFLPDYNSVVNGQVVPGAVVIPNQQVFSIVNPGFAQSILPTPILTAAQAGIPESLRYSQKTDFAPRVGFAWRPFGNDKTVVRGGYGRFIEALLGSAVLNAWAVEASDVGVFKNTLNGNVPTYTFPNPFPSNIAQPGTQDFDLATDLHYKDPTVQEWDITVERELGAGVGLRVSYDGNHGSNLGIIENLNQVPANTAGFSVAGAGAPFPIFEYIYYQTNKGYSNYNALTVAVQKRFSHGLQFQGSYIFAKNLSNVGGYNPTTTFAGEGGGTISDPYNPGLDYGNVNFTRRHRFLTTFLYELPFGKGKAFLNGGNGLVDRIVGGWQLGGVLLFQSGPFMTVLSAGDPSGTGFDQLVGNSRADTVAGVSPYANQSIGQWINPAAFATPVDNIGRFGSSAVGNVVGPGTQAVSMSLIKTVKFNERVHMQIGAEVANLFNHPNYATPTNLTLGTSGFASLTSLQTVDAGGPRAIQLTGRINF